MKVKTSKGFTLAELLIVMAIIVVLAAVAIPTFGKQLETARETGDMEVIRNAYTDALTFAVQDGADGELDGYIGVPPVTKTDKTQGSVTHTTATPGTYVVKVASAAVEHKDAVGDDPSADDYEPEVEAKAATRAFSQNGTSTKPGAWTYVSNTFMGYTVPPVCTATTQLAFKFKINDLGEVVIDGQGTGNTDLFTAQYT